MVVGVLICMSTIMLSKVWPCPLFRVNAYPGVNVYCWQWNLTFFLDEVEIWKLCSVGKSGISPSSNPSNFGNVDLMGLKMIIADGCINMTILFSISDLSSSVQLFSMVQDYIGYNSSCSICQVSFSWDIYHHHCFHTNSDFNSGIKSAKIFLWIKSGSHGHLFHGRFMSFFTNYVFHLTYITNATWCTCHIQIISMFINILFTL